MATSKQKEAARENLEKARAAQSEQRSGSRHSEKSPSISAAKRNHLPSEDFAFPKQRKEPLHDAEHVRNAIARFEQVEDVSDAERDRAWKRILAAAERFGVEVSAESWRELAKPSKASKPS